MEEEIQENQEVVELAPEVVERAKTMGWIPKEEFKGDESNWRPADEFVRRADDIMPIMKSQLGKYEEKIGRYESEILGLKASLESQQKATKKLVKITETVSEKAYDQAKRDLTKQQAQAVADGDVDKWQSLEDQKEKLEKPDPVEIEETPAGDPVFDQWHKGNNWYLQDPDMTIFANGYADMVKNQSPSMTYEQVLEAVEKKVKGTFPQKFENQNRNVPAEVDGGAVREVKVSENKKTYNNLPADAKQACDNIVNQGLMTKEDYIKEYFSEE